MHSKFLKFECLLAYFQLYTVFTWSRENCMVKISKEECSQQGQEPRLPQKSADIGLHGNLIDILFFDLTGIVY